jgi:hypothetical protein
MHSNLFRRELEVALEVPADFTRDMLLKIVRPTGDGQVSLADRASLATWISSHTRTSSRCPSGGHFYGVRRAAAKGSRGERHFTTEITEHTENDERHGERTTRHAVGKVPPSSVCSVISVVRKAVEGKT